MLTLMHCASEFMNTITISGTDYLVKAKNHLKTDGLAGQNAPLLLCATQHCIFALLSLHITIQIIITHYSTGISINMMTET